MSKAEKERHGQALSALGRLQKTLVRRLIEYVIDNDESLRLAAEGTEGYGYTLHQLDELFLARLNLVERAIAELQRSPARGTSRYRTLCFPASVDAVEQKINARFEKMPEARILGISVSPWGPSAGSPRASPEKRAPGEPSRKAPLLVTVLYYGPEPEGA